MNVEIEKLYKKYLNRSIPNKFLFSDVENVLINEYLSKSLDKKEMAFLVEPKELDFYNKCYIINNVEILHNLFTDQEKSDFRSLKELFKQYTLDPSETTNAEIEYTLIQEGEYLVIFLGVDSDGYIKDFKTIGNSERLFHRLVVLMGIEKEDCNLENRDFHDYLEALSNLGYLD
ncbi:hypothetical protein [Peribacillus phoenicis]|uniref:hypothetical protein n=1 Tax=unclassified Peribacillus TaxID=2675266 RepID=UPI0039A2E3A4